MPAVPPHPPTASLPHPARAAAGARAAARKPRRGLLPALLCLPLLISLTAPADAQTYRDLDVGVTNADEGEDIVLTLELNSAPGNVSAAQRTFMVSTAVPSTADVNSCIAISGAGARPCPNGSTPASASDFTATSTSVVFGTNETVKTVSIPTVLDTVSEGVEVVRINIDYNPGTSDLGIFNAGNSQYTGRKRFVSDPNESTTRLQINTYGEIDNEAALSISAPADANEGDSSTRDLEFTVTLSETRADTTNFNVCFTGTATNDTATTGAIAATADYRPGATFGGSFLALDSDGDGCIGERINSNQTRSSGAVTIRVKGDTDAESDETVIATLSSTESGVTVLNAEATHTILDDDTPAPEISVSLPISEGESRSDAGEKKVNESEGGVGIGFPLSANQPLPEALDVCVRVTESGTIDRVASADEGIQTVNMLASGMTNGSGNHQLTWTNTAADDPDSSVTVEVVAPNTASCSAANDSYTVSSSDASDKLLIQDDEDTTVSLTASSDTTMTEGDATDTAVLTISLDRRLYAGETIGVPIALATTTGARLPGSTDVGNVANHDFTVAAAAASMHSGVTLANALTANPRVVFTGHDTNTVQTATVTLTPVASRDDPDAAHETITATLSSLGLLDTTVSGGVTAHGTNNAATLTLEDDEAAPPATTCPAQNGIFSEPRLRILETGETTYCVRLTRPPSGGDTTVTIGTTGSYTGAATASPTTLTFTASNYQTPQQVTVTGVDQTSLHLNRTLSLTHTANGGNYTNWSLGTVRVEVDDAPELEAWDTTIWRGNRSGLGRRPSTITASNGFIGFRQDFSPGRSGLWYRLRLSSRPETGGTVTVTATSSDFTRFGLAMRPGDTPRQSLTVTFEDRDADPGCHNSGYDDIFVSENGSLASANGRVGEDRDGTPDTAWRCHRRIWVVSMQDLPAPSKGCSTISHTASGGGLRPTYVGSIRAHTISSSGSSCPQITGTPEAGDNKNYNPQASLAQAAPAPTEAVANVQVTAVDDASASVSWDAVPHATSYDVSWSAESGDSLSAGAGAESVTGTTATVRHDASVPMTLTVTVTPEYVDEHGDTQQLDALAGTATLEVGPGSGPDDGDGADDGGDGDGTDGGQGAGEPGTVPVAANPPAAVAHWRFDGDALDGAGSSHGTVGGGAAFAANDDGSGVGSHALVLDGIDDYVDLASHVSNFPLGDAARSVMGWFKADAGNQRQTFFTYGPNVAGQRFSIAADRTQVLVGVSGHAWGVNGLSLDDGWHHVVVTYAGGDSDSISIYLDGALQPASTLVGAPQPVDTRTGPAAIGRNVSGDAHYAGSIDDVRIYDVALSAGQVSALFNEHPQTPPPVTTAVTASATPGLAEGNLDGADVELTLDAGAFAATVATSDVTASGVSGVSVSSVTRDSDGQATVTLAFDGTDFDADATLTLTVSAAVLAHSDTDLAATLPVTAVDEPPPPPPPPPAVSIPAPLAHWKFDGDADDSAGSSNGSARNGASFTTAASVGSHALSLDGSDDHVDLASHASSFPLGNSARSVTGWFRADAGNQRQTLLTYGPNVEGKRLSIAADRTQAVVAVSGHAWGVNNLSLSDGWHHVAVTFAGGRSDDFSIYLNGALQSASTLGGFARQVDTRTGSAAIGRNVGGTAHYGGDIDDVRLYDHALSAEQVRAIADRRETASARDGARATAAMPGGLSPAPLALPRASGGADGTGAGGFGTDGFGTDGFGTDGFGVSLATASSSRAHAPLLPSASNPLREGLVRIVNPSAQSGEVRIVAIDDAGRRGAPVTLDLGAGASAQFTSRDLEWGNAALGLIGSTGSGTGDWRLEVSSGLDIEVLPYVRSHDGMLHAMGDVAPVVNDVHRVALFNPADSPDAASRLRLTNRGGQALRADITGIDDTGASPGGMVSVEIGTDASVLLTAAELEAGGSNLLGALGDGEGQWRLDIASEGDLAVMNLVETSDGHLTNLSNATATSVPAREAHVVDRFPSSSDLSNEQGVVRIVNGTGSAASVRIEPNDSTGWRYYAPLTLTLGANAAANLGTWDLELGNAAKGLSGGAGPGAGGAWRLAISSDSDIEVLTYVRAPNGLLKLPPGDTATEDKLR